MHPGHPLTSLLSVRSPLVSTSPSPISMSCCSIPTMITPQVQYRRACPTCIMTEGNAGRTADAYLHAWMERMLCPHSMPHVRADMHPGRSALDVLAYELKQRDMVSYIEVIASARIPIVKMTERESSKSMCRRMGMLSTGANASCVMVLGSEMAWYGHVPISTYASRHPNRYLVRCDRWCPCCSMDQHCRATPTSHASTHPPTQIFPPLSTTQRYIHR